MTHQEKIAILQEWAVQTEAANRLIEPVTQVLGLSVESPIHQAVWALQDAYEKAVGRLVGDGCEWLGWYAHEDDFGRKAMEAGPKETMRPIANIEDLIWVIEVSA